MEQPLQLPRRRGRPLETRMPEQLVHLTDRLDHRGDLPVRGSASEAAQGVQQSPRSSEVHAEVDLLVRHAAAGELHLVADEVLRPTRQRCRGIRVMRLRPPRDWVRACRHPEVEVPLGQLREGVGGIDDEPLSSVVRPERPALWREQVPGGDPVARHRAVAGDPPQRQASAAHRASPWLAVRGGGVASPTAGPARARGDGADPGRTEGGGHSLASERAVR